MSVGIQILAGTNLDPDAEVTFKPGVWLMHYDPDGNDGDGSIAFTEDPQEAIAFADATEAAAFALRASTLRPVVLGRLSRPLYDNFYIAFRKLD